MQVILIWGNVMQYSLEATSLRVKTPGIKVFDMIIGV